MFIMLVGLPYSGKSYYAEQHPEYKVLSREAIRAEIYGSESVQINPKKWVFGLLHQRLLEALHKGEDIIYDATNITSNGRKEVLKLIKEFDCKKVCIFFDTPKAIRTERAKYRARVVPEYAIARMEKLLEVPTVNEGWDEVIHLLSGREIRYSDFTVSQNEPFVWIEDDNIEGACWNVMLDAQCNVDEVFGTNVETPDNDAYLNVYANLTPSLEFITPELSVIYNEEGSPHDFEEWKRPLNEKEQKNILALIQRYAGQWLLEQAAKNKEDINA